MVEAAKWKTVSFAFSGSDSEITQHRPTKSLFDSDDRTPTELPKSPCIGTCSTDGRATVTGLLLVDHRNAGLWLPTGGHVEPEEHPRETVTRELVEELGFAPPHPIGPPLMITQSTTIGLTAGHVDVSLWYVVTAPRSQALQWDIHEFVDARWFDFADIPITRSDPHIRRFVTKLRAS